MDGEQHATAGKAMTDTLRGKVAIVTGAARGIGAATVRSLARDGAMVIATDVLDDRQEDVDTILSWAGPTFDQVSAIGSHGPFIDVLPTNLGPDIMSTLAALYPQLGLDGSVAP